jgi:type II secretory pathway pseudopilin PulG
MRSHIPRKSTRATRRRSGALRLLADSQAGFTIIEVVISAVLVALIAGATASALVATSDLSGDQRRRSQADEIAQQDQERLRGMSAKALATLNQTRTVGPYEGTNYTVVSTGKFLSNTGVSSCASSGVGAAAYVLVTSDVNWSANRRAHVTEQSLITPLAGGTLLTNVKDQNNAPLSGVTVTADGPDTESANTDSGGCTVFGGMTTGDYDVSVTLANYVDPDGNASPNIPSRPATVSGSGTSFPTPNPFKLGQAGLISAFFKTQIGATTYTDQRAPALSWANPGMTNSRSSPISATGSPPKVVPTAQVNSPLSPFQLYPFNNGTAGVYTNNYTVWAGSCDMDMPPLAADQSKATVGPGGWAILNDGGTPVSPRIKMPALILNVLWKPNSSTTPFAVTPAAVKITDGCGQSWWPDVRTPSAPTSPLGQLNYPGQPYAPDVTGQRLEVCADYTPNGGANYYRTSPIFPPKTRNDNFTAGTTFAVTIDATSGWNVGRCPT